MRWAADEIAGSRTGVFVGIGGTDYSQMYRGSDITSRHRRLLRHRQCAEHRRQSVSYVFDLRGPSLAVDTACLSALVALHFAVQSLGIGMRHGPGRRSECDLRPRRLSRFPRPACSRPTGMPPV